MRIELLEEVSSTNDYIKRYLPEGKDVIVCARRQSGGKGTKGRSFVSDEGGVYMTALTYHKDLPAEDAFRIMAHAAVSVCRSAARFGVSAEIKWANDVFANGKKLCGILIENAISQGKIDHSIVGIGVNVCNDLSSLGGIATSLSEEAGRSVSADEARGVLIEEYLKPSTFEEYLSYVRFLGKDVTVSEGERRYRALACRILSDGRLQVKTEDGIRMLSSAEISLKI